MRKLIRDHQKYFNKLLVLLDAMVIAAAYWFSWFLWLSGYVSWSCFMPSIYQISHEEWLVFSMGLTL